eukprot:1194781-Prorocentrum_minimum.AAC.10
MRKSSLTRFYAVAPRSCDGRLPRRLVVLIGRPSAPIGRPSAPIGRLSAPIGARAVGGHRRVAAKHGAGDALPSEELRARPQGM